MPRWVIKGWYTLGPTLPLARVIGQRRGRIRIACFFTAYFSCWDYRLNMKAEQVRALFAAFEAAVLPVEGIECWSARELQQLLGYSDWRNFVKVIEKAQEACKNASEAVPDHFVELNRMIGLGKGGQREIADFALTRYACYLVAQNGDSAKEAIAFAQSYFAVQTRKQELVEQRLLDVERVAAREKLTETEKKLSGILFERDVDDKGFAIIRSRGDMKLFGGLSTQQMKDRYRVPKSKPLADFLPTLTIKAKDFATELTNHNVVEKDLEGQQQIGAEHEENNLAVRNMLLKRGVKPELLPPEEDIAKLKRRLKHDPKNLPVPPTE